MIEIISNPQPDQFLEAMKLAAEHVYEEDLSSPDAVPMAIRELSESEIAVAVLLADPRRVQGFIAYGVDSQEAVIHALAVIPEARGQGFGRDLVGYVETVAEEQGAKEVGLQSLPDAMQFYVDLDYKKRVGRYMVKTI